MTDGWSGIRDQAATALSHNEKAVWFVCTYRGIPKPIVQRYNVGCFDRDSMLDDLFSELECPTKEHLYGRSWIAFFCEDIEGKPLTVELRALDGKEYHRLQHPRARVHAPFFGLSQSFELFSEHRQVALVEGAFEALTFSTITRFPCLALMTKFPTRKQERFLVRWSKVIHLFLNRDDAGRKAAGRISKFWAKKHPIIVNNSLWWENPALGLGMETDLNEVLQQRGLTTIQAAVTKGLRG